KEDAADATSLVAVLEEKILVTPGLVAVVVGDSFVAPASDFHRAMEEAGIGIVLRAATIEHRCQVGAATKPLARRHHHSRVHVDCGHVWVDRMGDQRDAGCPEARVFLGAWHLAAEIGGEFSVDSRGMYAHLLENA